MAQSPYSITGVSTIPVAIDLGGLYRKVQAGVTLAAGSTATTDGAVVVTATDVQAIQNSSTAIFNRTVDPGYTYYSLVTEGFFRYINVSTTAASSGNINVVLYFDGPGWPT